MCRKREEKKTNKRMLSDWFSAALPISRKCGRYAYFLKKATILILSLLSAKTLASERVVPEGILNSWGYKTASMDKMQHIKKIKIVGEYYPRFSLAKKCFESNKEAEIENNKTLESIKSSTNRGFKTYRDAIISDGCIYEVSTSANLFYLDYQPYIVNKLNDYISKK